jgi:transposase-like protein
MNTVKQMTFRDLLKRFPDEEACKAFLAKRRWPNGVTCPRCGNKRVYTLKARPFHWLCKSGAERLDSKTGKIVGCSKKNGYRFSVITKTVFENTNYPLREWFRAIFLMLHSKKGMSAHQIHRMLGTGSYETAWYMCTRIRAAMKDEELPKLMGEIEIDETFIGGRDKNRHYHQRSHSAGPYASGKIEVMGAIARKGNIVCQMIEDIGFHTEKTRAEFVRKVVSKDVSLVATDESHHYRNLRKEGVPHESIQHGQHEYVRGKVHTQTIESFWSLLKRGIIGNYHKVSAKYLPLYLNEFSFRFNNRKNADIFDAIIAGC